MTTMTLGISESKIRVIAPDVGGGFGGKLGVLPEEMLCVTLALKLGRPVKWTEARSESLLAAHDGRDQIQDIAVTAKRDGTVTGLDVRLLADGADGRRTVPVAQFFLDYFTTALSEDELLAEVCFPRYTGWRHHYEKFNRTAQAWSMVAVAVALNVDSSGTIAEARVGLTNTGTTPIRAAGVEEALVGQQAGEESAGAAAQRACEGSAAPSDADATADYREHLARVLTGRAVLAAL